MANDILRSLLAVSLIAGVAMLLLCAARVQLRRAFGARIAYAAWAAVPAAVMMSLLPAARMPAPVQHAVAPLRHIASVSAPAVPTAAVEWQPWLVAIWLTAAAAMLAWLWRAHVRYRRSLGPLRLQDGVFYADGEGPAVVGLWRPVIIVPDDFAMRYTPQEQQLILAHEAVHVRRRDPLMNALCALLQCVLWFHPLVHLAARRFRLDQELACDAAVMHAHPGLKRSYGEAMLKTQMSNQAALIHCHWQSIHPLKERIMQLQHTAPTSFRRLLGRATVTALVAACGYGAMAANAGVESTDRYMVKMKLNAGRDASAPALLVQEGVPASVQSTGTDGVWRTELVLKKAGDNSVFVKTVIKHDDRVVGNPGLLVPLGETAAVAVDDFKLQLAVSRPRD
jgi:beta-lactamase regulating signal transducer with metallopeptidase domain